MLKIGLTGGIASGKSSASGFFKEVGVDIIDADEIARDLFKLNSPHLEAIKLQFGDKFFDKNGELNRKALGELVFSDPCALEWLNKYTHPLINKKMKAELNKVQSPYVILDIPLLINIEGNIPEYLVELIDRVLVITSDRNTQIKRIMTRDKLTEEQAKKIIANQSSWEQKLAKADDVIENNGDLLTLREKVIKQHLIYLNTAPSS